MQPLYQWQASFDPLVRKFEQAKSKPLGKAEFRKMKCLIAKQITDDEKVILSGIDSTFTIEKLIKESLYFAPSKTSSHPMRVVFRVKSILLMAAYSRTLRFEHMISMYQFVHS